MTLPICTPVQRPNDIAIVLDRSGSIEEAGALEEVRSATQYLIDRTDLQTSQISLVTFNDSAQVAVPLSQDREALTGALVELTATGGTNIAAGVTYATLELSGNRRNPDAQPVIVLLSDGLARGDDAEAIVAAKLAKQQGIRVITIGLGANVNVALLQEMASAGDDFYLAPTKEDLALIYERITDTLVCEPVGT